MTARTIHASHVTTRTFRLELEGAPLVSFGLAGRLSPTRTTITATDLGAGKHHLVIKMEAINRHGVRMNGAWGAPTPTRADPREYGHDGAGHIDDLPDALVDSLLSHCEIARPDLPAN